MREIACLRLPSKGVLELGLGLVLGPRLSLPHSNLNFSFLSGLTDRKVDIKETHIFKYGTVIKRKTKVPACFLRH